MATVVIYDKYGNRYEVEENLIRRVKTLDWEDREAVQEFYGRDERGWILGGAINQTAICGAKGRRTGLPCKKIPLANGRCRIHGGLSGPTPESMKGNTNSLKTGEYQSLYLDVLDPDELEIWEDMETDALKQINEELRVINIRIRRMMGRIQTLKKKETVLTSTELESGIDGNKGRVRLKTEKRESVLSQIQAIEEALTRVQDKKIRLIEQKHKIEMDSAGGNSGVDGVAIYVKALSGSAEDVWEGHDEDDDSVPCPDEEIDPAE